MEDFLTIGLVQVFHISSLLSQRFKMPNPVFNQRQSLQTLTSSKVPPASATKADAIAAPSEYTTRIQDIFRTLEAAQLPQHEGRQSEDHLGSRNKTRKLYNPKSLNTGYFVPKLRSTWYQYRANEDFPNSSVPNCILPTRDCEGYNCGPHGHKHPPPLRFSGEWYWDPEWQLESATYD